MKMMKKLGLLSALSLALILTGCSSVTVSPTDTYKGQTAEQIFRGGEIALTKKEYNSATSHFEALDSLYPFSAYAEQALLDSIYAYYKSGDNTSAAASAERFIRLYPRSAKVDYAYYMKGVANFEQDRGWL